MQSILKIDPNHRRDKGLIDCMKPCNQSAVRCNQWRLACNQSPSPWRRAAAAGTEAIASWEMGRSAKACHPTLGHTLTSLAGAVRMIEKTSFGTAAAHDPRRLPDPALP